MKPWSEKLGITITCSICGGGGVAMRPLDPFNAVHSDPNVCREILEQRAKKIVEREKK